MAFYFKILLHFLFILCMYVWACVDARVSMKVRGQALEVSVLLPPCEFWESHLGPQLCWQVPLLTDLCYLFLSPLSWVPFLFLSNHHSVFVSLFLLISGFYIWEKMCYFCISESIFFFNINIAIFFSYPIIVGYLCWHHPSAAVNSTAISIAMQVSLASRFESFGCRIRSSRTRWRGGSIFRTFHPDFHSVCTDFISSPAVFRALFFPRILSSICVLFSWW